MVKHIFLLLSMLLVLVACKQDKVVPQASPMTSPATSEGDPSHMELPMNEQYVGTEACKACHEKEFESWHGSHHDMAMKKPTPETVRGDFNDITVTIKGKTTRFYTAEDGKYFIEDHLADGTKKAYEVIYTFGWEPLQQYLVEADGGRLQVYKLCWDTEQHKWFHIYGELRIADHDWLHWSKGGMNWNTMCSDCHSTHVQKNYDSEKDIFDTSYEIIHVSCEACHGPAHKHLEWAKNKTLPDKDDHYILKTFRNLDNKKFVDECARCHSRRGQITNLYDHSGEFSDHYQLSETVTTHILQN